MANENTNPPGVGPMGLTTEQVADLLNVSVSHVRRLVAGRVDGFPQPTRVGGCIRFDALSVERWFRGERGLQANRGGVAVQVRG